MRLRCRPRAADNKLNNQPVEVTRGDKKVSFCCVCCCSCLCSCSYILLTAVFESAEIWSEGSLRISLCVVVRAFAQLTGEEDTATGDGDGGGGGGN